MPEFPREVEIQRVINLVQGFGWEKVKEEMVGQYIQLTIRKKLLEESDITETGVPS